MSNGSSNPEAIDKTVFGRLVALLASFLGFSQGGVRKYMANTSWLVMDKVIRIMVGLVVGVWVARYLGPDDFGKLNFVSAFVGLFLPFAKLGIDGILVRDIVRYPSNSKTLLGSALVLKTGASFLMGVFAIAGIMLLRPDDRLMLAMTVPIALAGMLRGVDVFDLWFRAKVKVKKSVLASSIAFLSANTVKIILICVGANVVFFATTFLLESFLTVTGLLVAYRLSGQNIRCLSFDFGLAKKILGESWPLIFSGVFAVIYLQIDQIMLG